MDCVLAYMPTFAGASGKTLFIEPREKNDDAIRAIDRLVHANIKLLSDHLRVAYPSVDAEATVDAVFAAVATRIRSVPEVRTDLWLLGLARKCVSRDNHGKRWLERNAAAVVESIRRQAAGMDDWYLWIDTEYVIGLIERLSITDQEVLRLATCVDDLDAAGLAIILHISERRASALLDRVTAEFRQAYGDRPHSSSGGES